MPGLQESPPPSVGLSVSSPARPWGMAMLLYMLGMIGCITLLPFRFHWPDTTRVIWYTDLFDLLTNIALFMPFGFVHRLSLATPRKHRITSSLWVGLGISLGIEAAQLGLHGRYSSFLDVLSNGLGAWLGALLHLRVNTYLQRRILDRLALELPLMQLFYMLLPLLWLTCMVGSADPQHLCLALLLQWYGGSILGAVWRHRLRPARAVSRGMFGAIILGWSGLGTLPALAVYPWWLGGAGCGSALLLWGYTLWYQPAGSAERRFELPTLRSLAPLYGAYLIVLLLWPWPWMPGMWQASFGFTYVAETPGVISVLRLLEELTAMLLAGYMIAAYRGRQEESVRQTWHRILLLCVAIGGGLEWLRGWHPAHTASVAHLCLLTAAASYGGMLYRLQLAVVQALLQRRAAAVA